MKIYELIIVKGGFIYDGDSNEQEYTDDVEVKLYTTEQERNLAYNNLVDPYIKVQEFYKKTRDEIFSHLDRSSPNADREHKLWYELNKKCAEFTTNVKCDTECVYARVSINNSYAYIYIEVPDCNNCAKEGECSGCEYENKYRDDMSFNKFYYVFKKETEI